jgi:hypothetical protein
VIEIPCRITAKVQIMMSAAGFAELRMVTTLPFVPQQGMEFSFLDVNDHGLRLPGEVKYTYWNHQERRFEVGVSAHWQGHWWVKNCDRLSQHGWSISLDERTRNWIDSLSKPMVPA